MIYTVRLWTHDGPNGSIADERIVGSRVAARLCAESLLKPHAIETTWALRAHANVAYAIVEDAKGAAVACYDAPVTFVDSIGDRLRRGETVAL